MRFFWEQNLRIFLSFFGRAAAVNARYLRYFVVCVKRLPASSCFYTSHAFKTFLFRQKGNVTGVVIDDVMAENLIQFNANLSNSQQFQCKQAESAIFKTPAAHDIISKEPAHSAILDLTWRRREHVLSMKGTRSMKIFSSIFHYQKPDWIRRKWLNSLKYEMNFL